MMISCLIAAYRAGGTIGKALESIRTQAHGEWEVVVVEDGSRDQTEEVVRSFAASVSQRVHYENFGANRGVAAARTRLLELARGEAAAFLDADDWWTPGHLADAQRALAGGADVVVARIQLVDLATGRALGTYAPSEAFFRQPVPRLIERSEIMTSSCVTLRKTLATAAGAFDPALRIGEDRDYWLRCALQRARFADSGAVTCWYSKHAGSTMAKTLLWAEQEVMFHRKHFGTPGVSRSVQRRCYARALENYGRLARAGDPRASARALARSWRLRPWSAQAAAQYLASALRVLRR